MSTEKKKHNNTEVSVGKQGNATTLHNERCACKVGRRWLQMNPE